MSRGLYVIGLTGNIATGKTAVATMLAELGARLIDADALAHEVIRADTPAWQRVVQEFGSDILQQNGQIDRARLGALVFADRQALARLEAIVHPAVIAKSERLLKEFEDEKRSSAPGSTGPTVVVLEAIKLIESGMHRRCDEVWVVTCPHDQQLKRLVQHRGLSEAEAGLRIAAQPPQADKTAVADVAIDNSSDLERTRVQVVREWERIMLAHRERAVMSGELAQGGNMSSLRSFIDAHPFLTMWIVLAIGMVAIFLVTSRDAGLLPHQRLFMSVACVVLAGLCTWIISWE
jgi:dephospho-CoA kinase